MYETGIIIFPDDILELARRHHAGFFPLDARVRGYHLDARDEAVVFDFSSDEKLPASILPIGVSPTGLVKIGDGRAQVPKVAQLSAGRWNQVRITPGALLTLCKAHIAGIPRDAELVNWQVKLPTDAQGSRFHIFRLVIRTASSSNLEFDKEGKPKDLRVYIPMEGEELLAVGGKPN